MVRKHRGPLQYRIKAQRREAKTDAQSKCLYFVLTSWQERILRQIFLWKLFLGAVPRKNQLENGNMTGKRRRPVKAVLRRNVLESMSHRTVPVRKVAAIIFTLSLLIKTGPEAKRIPRYSIFGGCIFFRCVVTSRTVAINYIPILFLKILRPGVSGSLSSQGWAQTCNFPASLPRMLVVLPFLISIPRQSLWLLIHRLEWLRAKRPQ